MDRSTLASSLTRLLFPKRARFATVYTGNLFERLTGLSWVLEQAKESTVLDFGCAEGLIGYEFARAGASLIHGFDRDRRRIEFARLLFQEIPVESLFTCSNLAVPLSQFKDTYGSVLRCQYDIVLYLGIYHHLVEQISQNEVHELMEFLFSIATFLFVCRTNRMEAVSTVAQKCGFEEVYSDHSNERVGMLTVFRNRAAADGPSRREQRAESQADSRQAPQPRHLAGMRTVR